MTVTKNPLFLHKALIAQESYSLARRMDDGMAIAGRLVVQDMLDMLGEEIDREKKRSEEK